MNVQDIEKFVMWFNLLLVTNSAKNKSILPFLEMHDDAEVKHASGDPNMRYDAKHDRQNSMGYKRRHATDTPVLGRNS